MKWCAAKKPGRNNIIMKSVEQFVRRYENGQRFVVFDVETVGASEGLMVVEIGAVEAGQKFGARFASFQKILRFRPLSWKKYWRELQIHGIPSHEIENGEERTVVLQDFLAFTEGAALICHTNYDIHAMLRNLRQHQELAYALELPVWQDYTDSCKLARKICPELPSFSLTNLSRHFGIANPQAHRALADAWTTKKLIGKLLQRYYIALG